MSCVSEKPNPHRPRYQRKDECSHYKGITRVFLPCLLETGCHNEEWIWQKNLRTLHHLHLLISCD